MEVNNSHWMLIGGMSPTELLRMMQKKPFVFVFFPDFMNHCQSFIYAMHLHSTQLRHLLLTILFAFCQSGEMLNF